MDRTPADGAALARVAVLGAATGAGALVRGALETIGVPGSRVNLFAETDGGAVLSEYGGEARLIQPSNREELGGHRVVFLCEVSRSAAAAALVGTGCLVYDMTGEYAGSDGERLLGAPGVEVDRDGGGLFGVPHPLSIVLAELLEPLDLALGLCEATAFVLRPAADFGDAGIDELREQTLRLLRFERTPREVFGGQLAFNTIPQTKLPGDGPELEARVTREVARLLGWAEGKLALRCAAVPVFHGHAVSLRLEFRSKATVEAVRSAFRDIDGVRLAAAGSRWTPLGAPESRRTDVCDVSEDGLGGYWVWAIAGEARRAAAERAVRDAAAIAGLGAAEEAR